MRMTPVLGLLLLASILAACGPSEDLEAPPEEFFEGPPLVDGKGDSLLRETPAYDALPGWADLAMNFEALFAPDDPVTTLELTLIDTVREARRSDPRAFDEGRNPYRIRYAVYNLRNPDIVARLADAEDDGVDVQILIEHDQLDPAREWNTADEVLQERGFEFVEDHRELSAEAFETADLIGISGSGLMHLKTRIFETPQGRTVLSGSLNPGDNSVMNEETLHLIREPRVVARYVDAYEAVLRDQPFHNAWDDEAALNVLFTPAKGLRAGTKVLDWVAEENEQILLMVFSLRDLRAPGHDDSLVDLLAAKARAGVPVYVITDRKQSDGVDADGNPMMRDDPTDDRLRAAGVAVYEATNRATPFTAMHHKAAILGRTNIRVITDAANWTFAGLGSDRKRARNTESQLFIDSARLDGNRTGRRYLAQWIRVLSRYAHQSADDGEAPFEEVFAHLTSQQGWPSQTLHFTAYETQTRFGESVWVRGNHEALGQWGDAGAGVLLETDEAQYPAWTSPEPVAIPLAADFEWKLVAGESPQAVRWENGDNRRSFAAPSVLLDDDFGLFEGVWQ